MSLSVVNRMKPKRTRLLTRIQDDRLVVEAQAAVLTARRELDTLSETYQRTRHLVEGHDVEGGCSEHDRIQAQLDLPKQTESFFLARLNLLTCEATLKEVKDQALQTRLPLLTEQLKVAVRERQQQLDKVVPLDRQVRDVYALAMEVLGGSQTAIPPLGWPEFDTQGNDCLFLHRTRYYQKDGWL